ncbi:MAG: FHA domain-containing protein [Planctomycetota bacterium]|jgi:pSer/pThr/pTyr-binding forkhead associated (FHA) protein
MAVIQITTPKNTRVIELPDELAVLGRQKDNDIIIEDKLASRRHCSLQPYEDAFILCDLDSRNGTRIKNKPIDKAVIKDGDIFRIGRTKLRIFKDSAPLVELIDESQPSPNENEETNIPTAKIHYED